MVNDTLKSTDKKLCQHDFKEVNWDNKHGFQWIGMYRQVCSHCNFENIVDPYDENGKFVDSLYY